MAYRKVNLTWEKLVGAFTAACQERGDLVRDQKAAEDAIFRFLSRHPEAHQPEDLLECHVLEYLRTQAYRGEKWAAVREAERIADFWDFLIDRQGYSMISNPWRRPLLSRWGSVNALSRNQFSRTNKLSEACSSGTGHREKEPPSLQSV